MKDNIIAVVIPVLFFVCIGLSVTFGAPGILIIAEKIGLINFQKIQEVNSIDTDDFKFAVGFALFGGFILSLPILGTESTLTAWMMAGIIMVFLVLFCSACASYSFDFGKICAVSFLSLIIGVSASWILFGIKQLLCKILQ